MSTPVESPFALVPARLWDGESESTTTGNAVVVSGNRIMDIRTAAGLPPEIKVVSLPDCTLLPGLIDSHVHYIDSSGPAYLAAGVTTVRDTGNRVDWILRHRAKNARDMSLGPRILSCGQLLDGKDGLWTHMVKRHTTAASLRKSIQENVRLGVDAIKLYASLDPELVRVGVQEAHKHGMFVLAHLNKTSADAAIDAGLDEIEHFSRCDVGWREATTKEDDRLIDKILKKGTIMNPTIVVWDRLGRALEHNFLHDTRRRWVHPDLLAIWERFPYRRCEPAHRFRLQKVTITLKRFFMRCHQRGVTIAAGTDAPFLNLIPGFSLHDELAQFVDTGLRPVDALRSATSINAKVIGVGDKIGRIKIGMEADLVAVRGNPLDRIDAIGDIDFVMRQGQILHRGDLFEAVTKKFAEPLNDPIVRDLRPYVAGDLPRYSQKTSDE